MLATVKADIAQEKLDTTPFGVFFNQYVMQVQDTNIDQELAYMLKNNVVSVDMIDRAIADAFKEVN